jgi:PilZ domain
VLFFRKLLTYTLGSRLSDHRHNPRHLVGESFPLKGTVTLLGTDQIGVSRTAPGSGCRWSGRPLNLSLGGLNMHLPPAAIAAPGEETFMTLTVDGRELEIPCVVAHFRSTSRSSLCGLSLRLTNPAIKAAYNQLLEAVGIGASFSPVRKLREIPAPAGLVGEQYRSGKKYVLTAWRRAGGRELAGFEMLLGEYCARGVPGAKDLEIYSRQPENRTGKVANSAPTLSLSAGKHAEVRQLYRWVVLNLPKSLPTDLRTLLGQFIAKSERAS